MHSIARTRRLSQSKVGETMDYPISINSYWTIWLLVHLILSVGLLGALTHQAVSAMMPVRQMAGPGGFVTRFRAVPAAGYATAVCVLWVLTFILGSFIYTKYRIYIRIPIEQAGFWWTQGFFDFKEHVASIGLTLLPADLGFETMVVPPIGHQSVGVPQQGKDTEGGFETRTYRDRLFNCGRGTSEAVEFVRSAPITPEQRAKIFSGNAASFLRL